MFSVLYGVLIDPFPYKDAGRLVLLSVRCEMRDEMRRCVRCVTVLHRPSCIVQSCKPLERGVSFVRWPASPATYNESEPIHP
jgi:hypothetical protein